MNFNGEYLDRVYREAITFAESHYENFPVISRFLSKEIRPHVALIYKFARQADDIADEGKLGKSERLSELDSYRKKLSDSLEGNFEDDFWKALKNSVDIFRLDTGNLFKLLNAFAQDVVKNRYVSFAEILDYCKNSADPVGRLILEFHNIRDEETAYYSDKVCTALQLTNFYQDVSVDFERGRLYIPEDEMKKFGVNESLFSERRIDKNFSYLMQYQLERVQSMFDEGRKIIDRLPGSLKYQIKWTILGGEEILSKIQKIQFDVLNQRPKLTKYDYFRLMIKSLTT